MGPSAWKYEEPVYKLDVQQPQTTHVSVPIPESLDTEICPSHHHTSHSICRTNSRQGKIPADRVDELARRIRLGRTPFFRVRTSFPIQLSGYLVG